MPNAVISAAGPDHVLCMRAGRRVEYLSIAWTSLEAVIGITIGVLAGSVALIGFGADSVIEVASGQDSIAKAKAEKPDAIVMDVVMPGVNGFQATRSISKDPETSGIPARTIVRSCRVITISSPSLIERLN